MSKAIFIGSTTHTSSWLDNCLKSLKGFSKYPIICVINDDFELGKLRWIYDNTTVDEIFLMHDTVEIKDLSLFDIIFQDVKSVAITDRPCAYGMFMGKYLRSVLNKMEIPITKTKLEAVEQEILFNNRYVEISGGAQILFPGMEDSQTFEYKFGRNNKILENEFLKKYKGTWSRSMI